MLVAGTPARRQEGRAVSALDAGMTVLMIMCGDK